MKSNKPADMFRGTKYGWSYDRKWYVIPQAPGSTMLMRMADFIIDAELTVWKDRYGLSESQIAEMQVEGLAFIKNLKNFV